MKRIVFVFVLALLGASQNLMAADRSMVTVMESEHVDVTVTFTGQDTFIFGAMGKPGDVIIKVMSPTMNVDLSHKNRIGPFWLDGDKLTVRNTPGLYYLLSSRPLDEIVTPEERFRYGLHLHDAFVKAQLSNAAPPAMHDWQDAFIAIKEEAGLFRKLPDAVKLVKNRLFSAHIQLPANIPLGIYHLEVYLAQHGHIISHQPRTLEVNQVKLERWIANAVNLHAWVFGISFTVFALLLGLTLGMALRRT